MKPKKKHPKTDFVGSTPQRSRGRPVTRVIEPINATSEELVQAMFWVADRERDEREEDPS